MTKRQAALHYDLDVFILANDKPTRKVQVREVPVKASSSRLRAATAIPNVRLLQDAAVGLSSQSQSYHPCRLQSIVPLMGHLSCQQ